MQNSKMPFVLVNMAMTADGKIATVNSASRERGRAVSSFGSRRDHDHLLALRATADAVMCGARTADLNAINLGPGGTKFRSRRLKRGLAEFNLRVIVSGSGSVSPRAEVFQHRFSPLIILTTRRASAAKLARLRHAADEVKVCGVSEVNWLRTLRWLRRRWGVKRLLVEGGGELNMTLFRAGLVHELHLTICPKIFGGRTSPGIADGDGFLKLADAALMELQSRRRVGDELFLVYRRPRLARRKIQHRR